MKNIFLITGFFILLFFASCEKKPDCLKSSGPLTTQERSSNPITYIELLCNADLIIHPDSVNRIRVLAGSNLIDKIETEVEGSTLRIRNKNRCNWVRSFNPTITVDVWTNSLHAIRTDGSSGDVTFSDTLHVYDFRFDSYSSLGIYNLKLNCFVATLALHNGPADFMGEGKVAVSYVYNAGFGKMDFRNIESEKIFMNNRGTNDIYVNASLLLEARIEGSGSIYYKGKPDSLSETIIGSGHVLPLQ